MKISEVKGIGKWVTDQLEKRGIFTVADAHANPNELHIIRGLGKIGINRIMNAEPAPLKAIPCRMSCAICGGLHAIDYIVPNDIWAHAIHPFYQNSLVCIMCFIRRADEKLLPWDKVIKIDGLYSMASQIKIQEKVKNS